MQNDDLVVSFVNCCVYRFSITLQFIQVKNLYTDGYGTVFAGDIKN